MLPLSTLCRIRHSCDNAKVYHARALKAACYAMHINLIHRKAGDPSPGGLVERIFGTNQQQFEAEVRAGDILSASLRISEYEVSIRF